MKILLLVAATAWSLGWSADAAAQGADQAAFTAPPAELLALARATRRGDEDVVILREADVTAFDQRGLYARSRRVVVAIYTERGAEQLMTIAESWSPLFEERPRLRARVIAPRGAVREFTPTATPSGAPAPGVAAPTSQLRQQVVIELPKAQPGSVIEYEIVTAATRLRAGSVAAQEVYPGNSVRTSATHIVISAPRQLGLKVLTRGAPLPRPLTFRDGAQQRWTADLPELPAWRDATTAEPTALERRTRLVFSANGSWQRAAETFRDQVEATVQDAKLDLPADVRQGDLRQRAAKAVRWMHQALTPLEGDLTGSSWQPRAVAATLAQRSATALDAAVVLVAALRQLGVPAELALSTQRPSLDVDPDLPALNVFESVAVQALVDGRPLWIDPEARGVRPGVMLSHRQGRNALVLTPKMTGLTRTPVAAPADNRLTRVVTYDLAPAGPARVTEVEELTGTLEQDVRAYYRTTSAADRDRQIKEYALSKYGSKNVTSFTPSDPEDLTAPTRTTLVVNDAASAFAQRAKIVTRLSVGDVLLYMPTALRPEPDEPASASAPLRWDTPYVMEIEHRFVVPDGFAMPQLPASDDVQLGALRIQRRTRVDGKMFILRLRFDSGRRDLSSHEVAAVRAAVAALEDHATMVVEFPQLGLSMLERGELHAGLRELQRLAAAHPQSAIYATQLARGYVEAGMLPRRAAPHGWRSRSMTPSPLPISPWRRRRRAICTSVTPRAFIKNAASWSPSCAGRSRSIRGMAARKAASRAGCRSTSTAGAARTPRGCARARRSIAPRISSTATSTSMSPRRTC